MNLALHRDAMGCFAGELKAHGVERYNVKVKNDALCLYLVF